MTKSTPTTILISIAKVLDELKIDYYVSGGFAVSVWAKPRFTADIDLIIKMTHQEKKSLAQKIKKLFPEGYLDPEQIDTALARHGEFNFIEPDTGMKVDFWVAKDEDFEKECFKNSKIKDVGYKVKFISSENLIISKLIWYSQTNSSRHIEDAQNVLKLAEPNKNYIKKWALKLKLENEFEKMENL
jgi:hypothetical protein